MVASLDMSAGTMGWHTQELVQVSPRLINTSISQGYPCIILLQILLDIAKALRDGWDTRSSVINSALLGIRCKHDLRHVGSHFWEKFPQQHDQ